MEVLDFMIIKAQQGFEADAVINPINIKIENDRMDVMFEKYQKKR